jgi:hypothetical protein
MGSTKKSNNKKVHQKNPQILTKLINKCLQFGYFPKVWKKSIIKIILKSSEKPKNNITFY